MKVYIVTRYHEFAKDENLGVFNSIEAAKWYAKENLENCTYAIEEWEVQKKDKNDPDFYVVTIEQYYAGDGMSVYAIVPNDDEELEKVRNTRFAKSMGSDLHVYSGKWGEEHPCI